MRKLRQKCRVRRLYSPTELMVEQKGKLWWSGSQAPVFLVQLCSGPWTRGCLCPCKGGFPPAAGWRAGIFSKVLQVMLPRSKLFCEVLGGARGARGMWGLSGMSAHSFFTHFTKTASDTEHNPTAKFKKHHCSAWLWRAGWRIRFLLCVFASWIGNLIQKFYMHTLAHLS